MFDFIPLVVDGLTLSMYPQPPEYDVGLFIRPYRKERLVININVNFEEIICVCVRM